MVAKKIIASFVKAAILTAVVAFIFTVGIKEKQQVFTCTTKILFPNEETAQSFQKLIKFNHTQKRISSRKVLIAVTEKNVDTCKKKNSALKRMVGGFNKERQLEAKEKERKAFQQTAKQIIALSKKTQKLKTALEEAIKKKEKLKQEGAILAQRYQFLTNKLNSLQIEKEKLLRKYTLHHPEVAEIDNEIKVLKKEIAGLPKQQTDEFSLKEKIANLTAQYQLNKAKIDFLQDKKKSLLKNKKIAPIKILQQNSYTKKKSFLPKKTTITIISTIFFLPVFFIFLKTDDTIYATDMFPEDKKLDTAASLPVIKSKSPFFTLPFVQDKEELLVLKHIADSIDKKAVFVSGFEKGTGKTVFSLNLAAALAKQGKKTALVNLNPSSLRVKHIIKQRYLLQGHNFFAQEADTNLFYFNLVAIANLDKAKEIQKQGLDRLAILEGWGREEKRIEASSKVFAKKDNFDYIIYDCGILNSSLLKAVKENKGELFLIVRCGKTSLSNIARGRELLRLEKIEKAGVVFNLCT